MLTPAFHAFFDELQQNMHRDWFHAHRDRFRADVYEPFLALTAEVKRIFEQYTGRPLLWEPRQLMFRIYRDIRFSADKSPYKLWMGAVVSQGGRKNDRYPEIYFQFGARENVIGAGLYRPSKEVLTRIRQAIAREPERIRAIHQDPLLRRYFPQGLQGERNKRLPVKDWMEIAIREPLILNKQFYTLRTYHRHSLYRPDLAEFIMEHYRAMEAWNSFLENLLKE